MLRLSDPRRAHADPLEQAPGPFRHSSSDWQHAGSLRSGGDVDLAATQAHSPSHVRLDACRDIFSDSSGTVVVSQALVATLHTHRCTRTTVSAQIPQTHMVSETLSPGRDLDLWRSPLASLLQWS